MTQTITVEEIPVPLSLFLFRHYLNNMQSERKSLKKPPSATPTTYFISTDPVPINDNAISSVPSTETLSVQLSGAARPSSEIKNNPKKSSVNKYRNLAAATFIDDDNDKTDTTWMNNLETSSLSEPPSQKNKGKSKNKTKNKKQKQSISSKNAKVNESASIKLSNPSTQDAKLQEIIAPFLLVNVNDNDDENDESWTTVTKR